MVVTTSLHERTVSVVLLAVQISCIELDVSFGAVAAGVTACSRIQLVRNRRIILMFIYLPDNDVDRPKTVDDKRDAKKLVEIDINLQLYCGSHTTTC